MAGTGSGGPGRCADAHEDGASLAPQLVIVLQGPSLSITNDGSRNIVSWPTDHTAGYRLQFNSDLTTTNWVNVSSNGFFRLIK